MSSSGVVAYLLGCVILVNEFKLHSLYCIHFLDNTLGKCMNLPQTLPAVG